MLQVIGKSLHLGRLQASGFRQVAILGQVACFRFSASCYTWAGCMLQVFGKLLYLGRLHASGFWQVATLGLVACFRFSASRYTWVSCMLQGDFGKLPHLRPSCMLQGDFGKLLHLGRLHASGFRQVATLGLVACFRFSASRYTWVSCMLQGDFGKLPHLRPSCMLQGDFGKLLHLGRLHTSG